MYYQLLNLNQGKSTREELIALGSCCQECTDFWEVTEKETYCCEDAKYGNVDTEEDEAAFVFASAFYIEIFPDGSLSIANIFLHYLSILFLSTGRVVHRYSLLLRINSDLIAFLQPFNKNSKMTTIKGQMHKWSIFWDVGYYGLVRWWGINIFIIDVQPTTQVQGVRYFHGRTFLSTASR